MEGALAPLRDAVPQASSAPGTHPDLIHLWLASLPDDQFAEGTVQAYRKAAKEWIEYLALLRVDQPGPRTVSSWVTYLTQERRLKTRTMLIKVSAIRSFYRWAEQHELFPNIARSLRLPSPNNDTPLPCPTPEDIRRMLELTPADTLPGKRTRALIAVMFSTGLRCISLARATVGDYDPGSGTLRHQPKGHVDKDARTVLSRSARELLLEYFNTRPDLHTDAPLFDAAGNRKSPTGGLSTRSMRRIILDLSEQLGLVNRSPLDNSIQERGYFAAHSIRRSSTNHVYENFGLLAAQVHAGHKSSDTTAENYARVKKFKTISEISEIMDL